MPNLFESRQHGSIKRIEFSSPNNHRVKIASIFSLAFGLLLLLGTIRGGATSLAKFVTINDVPAISYAMWQSLTAALLLLIAGYLKTKRLPSFRDAGVHYLFCGIVGAALPNVLFFISIKNMNAGAMAVILTLGPIFTYTLLLGLGREALNRFRLIGLILGLIGGGMIALGNTESNFSFNVFYLIALLCPILYASMSVYVSCRMSSPADPFLVAGATHLVSFMALLPVGLITQQIHPIWITPDLTDGLILLHGAIGATAYALLFKIIELAGPIFYSFSSYIIAVTGVIWGVALFGEQLTPGFLIATVAIFAGLYLINAKAQCPQKTGN